jgi:hypothetical protein
LANCTFPTLNQNTSGNAATATAPQSGGSFITSSNIGSQSVNYANTAGNGGVTSVNGSTGAVTVASLGVGQTWQNLTGSRSIGTTYTNSTGKPIMVIVFINAYNGTSILVDGTDIFGTIGSQVNTIYSISFVVPSGSTYNVQYNFGTTTPNWAELR